jgi:hypothetical protein
MTRIINCLVLLLVPIAAFAEEHTTYRTDAEYGVRYAEERVVRLPQDQGKFYLTILGNRNDARVVSLQQWFHSHPTLKSLKSQTHYNVITTDTVMFRDRYASSTQQVPCVRLQSPDGQVISEYAGAQLPLSADSLARGMANDFRSNWPCPRPGPCPGPGPCPRPQPQPEPEPTPEPGPDPDDGGPPFIPGPSPSPAPFVGPGMTEDMPPVWLLVVLLCGGFVGGGIAWWKETYFAK